MEAPTFDNLQDLKEQDFEQLDGGKCHEACWTYCSFLTLLYIIMHATA
jgi:hypothetical protein